MGCPSCRRSMQWRVVPEGSVQYLDCPAHGAWFDCFELARLVSPDRDRVDPSLAKSTGATDGAAAWSAAAIDWMLAFVGDLGLEFSS